MAKKLKIFFIGTPQFGAIVLEKMINAGYAPLLVVAGKDKPVGRKKLITSPPVKKIAQKYDISILQPEKLTEIESVILDYSFDLGVTAAYGKILPQSILNIPKQGFFNVHPSLLPQHRGASPIQSAILNNDKEFGVSIIKMIERVDAGPIIAKRKIKMKDPFYQELHDRLAIVGADLLVECLIAGKINPKQQDESKATHTKVFKKEDGRIDWENETADYIERKIRAFHVWPGCYTFWDNNGKLLNIKILKGFSLKSDDPAKHSFGKVLAFSSDKIKIQCQKNFLVVEKIKIEGRNELKIKDFLKGRPNFINSILK